ncbi:hypothetical protein BCR44DRAFT_173332 [Catenaria anguillulae PL171]|uniref:Uncharacterized protein n=1 Tax=Catenaria anguillulae PL171 TaxID=765915 RepID=A0A1Y2HB69_9FUNG|nr:hypothetical protein BCR44DRAFT_173332 [Catenaria anguillulae PL171]
MDSKVRTDRPAWMLNEDLELLKAIKQSGDDSEDGTIDWEKVKESMETTVRCYDGEPRRSYTIGRSGNLPRRFRNLCDNFLTAKLLDGASGLGDVEFTECHDLLLSLTELGVGEDDEQDEVAFALQDKNEEEAKRTAELSNGSLSTGRMTKQEQLKSTLDESHENEVDKIPSKKPRLTQGETGHAKYARADGRHNVSFAIPCRL